MTDTIHADAVRVLWDTQPHQPVDYLAQDGRTTRIEALHVTTEVEEFDDNDRPITAVRDDWLVLTETLVAAGQPIRPRPRDHLETPAGDRFRVTASGGRCHRPHDQTGILTRIHTTRVPTDGR